MSTPIAVTRVSQSRLTEAFGAGTAAIVAPIACICYRLVAIQTGREPDQHN